VKRMERRTGSRRDNILVMLRDLERVGDVILRRERGRIRSASAFNYHRLALFSTPSTLKIRYALAPGKL
jgi:hypothetical protein